MRDPRVLRISYDHDVRCSIETTAGAIGADQVRDLLSTGEPLDGRGVAVAVIDSGIWTRRLSGVRE